MITHHLRTIYRIYLQLIKENWKFQHVINRLEGSWPIMPKNIPIHYINVCKCTLIDVTKYQKKKKKKKKYTK